MSQGQKSGRAMKLKDFIDKICKMPINDLEALNQYVTCLKKRQVVHEGEFLLAQKNLR